jgi:hypothetical protein
VMKIKIAVFWVLTPCSDVVGYQHFGGPVSFINFGIIIIHKM